MSEYDEMPRGDWPEFYLAEIVAQTNMRSLALAIRREPRRPLDALPYCLLGPSEGLCRDSGRHQPLLRGHGREGSGLELGVRETGRKRRKPGKLCESDSALDTHPTR